MKLVHWFSQGKFHFPRWRGGCAATALALCLLAPGAGAFEVTFGHHLKGLTPNADGVYVVEPGAVLEYRVILDLSKTKPSDAEEASYDAWWRQMSLLANIEEGDASTGDFGDALPAATNSPDVVFRKVLDIPASAAGVEFFRSFSWTRNAFFGSVTYAGSADSAGRDLDRNPNTAGLKLGVSKTAAATVIRPTGGAGVRTELPTGDQLVMLGISIPTADTTGTNGVEMDITLSGSATHWSGSPVSGSTQEQEFLPPTTTFPPALTIRFSSPEPDVTMEFVNEGRQVIATVESRGLATSASADNAATIARFHITDGGADGFPAVVERLSLGVSVSGYGLRAISDDMLRAFNYRLVNLDADAPAAARVDHEMVLEGSGSSRRLVADLSASPISFGGSTESVTVYYQVQAYLRDTSVAITEGSSFDLLSDENSLVLGAGSGLSAINPEGANFSVSIAVQAYQFHITGMETKDLSGSSGFYRVGDAYPTLRLTGEWRDAYGNVDEHGPDPMSAIAATITKVGGQANSAAATASAFSVTTIDFDDDALDAFTTALKTYNGRTAGAADTADGSRWSIAVALNENPGGVGREFRVDILPTELGIHDLRIQQAFSHGVATEMTFTYDYTGIDDLPDKLAFDSAGNGSRPGIRTTLVNCAPGPCNGTTTTEPTVTGGHGNPPWSARFSHTPNLPAPVTANSQNRAVTISLGGAGAVYSALSVMLGDAHLAHNSPERSFVINPKPSEEISVAIAYTANAAVRTDGNDHEFARLTITNPENSDSRYTAQSVTISQIRIAEPASSGSSRDADRQGFRFAIDVVGGVADVAPNAPTFLGTSLSGGSYTVNRASELTFARNIAIDAGTQPVVLSLRLLAENAAGNIPSGITDGGNPFEFNSITITGSRISPANGDTVAERTLAAVTQPANNGMVNVDVVATNLEASLRTPGACGGSAASAAESGPRTITEAGTTLICPDDMVNMIAKLPRALDDAGNVDTHAYTYGLGAEFVAPGGSRDSANLSQILSASDFTKNKKVNLSGVILNAADKSTIYVDIIAGNLPSGVSSLQRSIPFTLNFKNTGATVSKPSFSDASMLRHRASSMLQDITVTLSNTYTNTHDVDTSQLALQVTFDCMTTASGSTANGCTSDSSFRWNSMVPTSGYIDFEEDGGAMLTISGLTVTPHLDLDALRGIGVADAQMRVTVSVYRRDNDEGMVIDERFKHLKLGESAASDAVTVQGQAAELSYSVSAASDRSLDSVANVGVNGAKKIADVTVSDGGTDSLSGRITGINIANDSTRVVFVLTADGGLASSPYSGYPLIVDDGATAVELDVYAYIADSAASSVIDGLEAAATLQIQADATSNDGADLHSTAASDAPAIHAAMSIVVTQVRFNVASVSGLNNGKWDIRDPSAASDLRLRLSVTDANGNRRLQHAGITRSLALYSAAHPSGLGAFNFPANYYEFTARSISDGDGGVSEISLDIFDLPSVFRTNPSDGSALTLHYFDSEIGSARQLSGLTVELNYIADASEISTATSSLMPSPAVSAKSATLAGLTLRAYNTWSGQTDLDATPGADGDISARIIGQNGVSCTYPVASGTPECEVTEATAVATDADNDGVWTFADGIVFTPALTGTAPTPMSTDGRLGLSIALSWTLPDSAHNFTAPAEIVFSGVEFTAVKPVVIGFVQQLYTINESQQARVCAGILFGDIPSDAGDLILMFAADDAASSAERGSDFNFAPMGRRMNAANRGDQCVDVAIIDDKLPENTESVQINVSAEWETPNEVPLSVSPVETTIEVADDDNIRVRVEAGRLDDNGVFSVNNVVTEESFEGDRPSDPSLLRISFWTDEDPPRPFTDNLGGDLRRIVLNVGADADSGAIAGCLNPAIPLSDVPAGVDVCLGESERFDADHITFQESITAGFGDTLTLRYAREGVHEIYLEILARLDDAIEGEEIVTFDVANVHVEDADPSVDAAYIPDPRNTTLTVSIADGEAPEVRYFLTATDEQVSSLNVPEGATPAISFHAGVFDKNTGAALALKEAFSFEWTITDPAGSVISITAGEGTALNPSTGRLTLTIPAGVATMVSFALQAREDDNSISETGFLQYTHRSGAANIEHPATISVMAVDNDDGVSPSACVGAIDSIDALPADEIARDAAQANCLRVRESETGAFGFTLEWDAARDRQDVGPSATALTAPLNADPYTIYLVEQAAGACPAPPDRPPPRQMVAGLSGGAVPVDSAYPTGYTLAADAVGALEVVIDKVRDVGGIRVSLKAETRYCAILRVTDGAWVDWAPQPVEVRTVAYSSADADDNGVPDHLDPGAAYADLEAYLTAECGGIAQTSLLDYDCDVDGVPDALELRFGRAFDVSISPMALNCRANGLRTRLAADLPSLTCSGATTALDAISDQTLVHAADNEVPAAEPGGVVINVADPDMLGEEMFLPGRYWLSGDTADSVVNLGLERAVEISAPEVTTLDGNIVVRGRALGRKLGSGLQVLSMRLSHSTPVESIDAGDNLVFGDPAQADGVVSDSAAFLSSSLASLSSRPEVTELLLRMTWTDEVGDGVLQQRILISRPGTTPTLFVPSSEAGMLSIAGGGTFLADGVLTLAEESSAQTLAVSVDSRPSVSADRWTLTVAGADPTMAPLYFTDSTDTRRAGLTLNQASLDLPLAFLLSLDLTLPARLLISWSGEESGADHGAHAVVLIFAPGSTPTAAAKTALLDGYRLGGHYRDGETPREVRPGPGAKIRLGDYAAQRCLQEPDVCSGREELPDRGLGLSAAGDARHPACPRLGAAALPCLDFQLFCDASADECMSGGAVDVVFPLNAPLRADHWLYYSQPRALDGAGRTCPFVQTGMPAHVAAQASRYAQDRCPGVDVSATPPAFRAEPIYPDRIYAAPDSIASACPPIGDTSWRSLAEMQDSGADLSTVNCLRVAYSDGGPNDSAPNEAALIADPMGVGAPGAAADGFDPLAGNFGSGGGGGALGVLALLALLALTLLSLISTGERSGRRPNPAFLAILLALALGAAPQARAADWKVFDDAGEFFGEVFSGDFFAEGAWATGLDLALSGFDRDISGVQEDADDNDYGFRLRGHWDQDGVWGEGLAAELWWADLGSAALRPDGGGEEADFDYEAYGLGLTWGWALPRFDWLSIGGFDLNPNHVFAGGGWRDIDVADADGDGAYFTTGLSWNVGEWFNAPDEEWSLRVSYDVFDSEGVDYFAIGLTHRFGAAQARPAATREARKRVTRRVSRRAARRGAVPSCGEWDACACQRPINANARGWYVQVATYSDNGLAVARKRMRQLREAGYREVGLRDNGRGLHALRVSVRGDCREAEALKGRLDALLNVDSMLRGWKDRPY